MKHFAMIATVVAGLSAATLGADQYYQQEGAYYPSYSGNPTQWNGYTSDSYGMSGGSQGSYSSSPSQSYMNTTSAPSNVISQPSNIGTTPSNLPNQTMPQGYNSTSYSNYPSMNNPYDSQNYMQSYPTQSYPMQSYPYQSNDYMQNRPAEGMRNMRGNLSAADYQNPSLQMHSSMDQAMKMNNDNDKFATDEDRRLGFQIRQQVAEKNPGLNLSGISLFIDDGTVRITGQVKNDQEKTQLSQLIKEIKGVKSVNNKVEVARMANSPLAMTAASGNTQNVSPYNPPNSAFPNSTSNWSNTFKGNSTVTGQEGSLADKIRQAISNDTTLSPQAQRMGITVTTSTITLNGTVKSESEKNRVLSKVKDMSEGRKVNNLLEISASSSR